MRWPVLTAIGLLATACGARTERTVANQVQSVFRKLGARSRLALVNVRASVFRLPGRPSPRAGSVRGFAIASTSACCGARRLTGNRKRFSGNRKSAGGASWHILHREM
jgi:hypothetical protein